MKTKPAVRIMMPPTHRDIATTTSTDVAETQAVFLPLAIKYTEHPNNNKLSRPTPKMPTLGL